MFLRYPWLRIVAPAAAAVLVLVVAGVAVGSGVSGHSQSWRIGYHDGYYVLGQQQGLWGDSSKHGINFACLSVWETMLGSGTGPGGDWGAGCVAGATQWVHDSGGY